jgi:hypothetical protein
MRADARMPFSLLATAARSGRGLFLLVLVQLSSCAWAPSASAAGENRLRIVERSVNLDGDRLHEGLEVECYVVLEKPGRWDVALALTGEHACFSWLPGTALALTRANFLGDWTRRPDGYRFPSIETDAHGRAHFVAYFKGEDLARFSSEGPWKLCLVADRAPGLQSAGEPRTSRPLRVELEADTWAWSREQFDIPDPAERGRPRVFDGIARGEELVFGEGLDLVAVTVTKVDSGGTRRRPPRIEVRVDDVLRGTVGRGPLEVLWAAEPDTTEADTPHPAPPLRSRWILGGDRRFTTVWVSFARARWRFSRGQLAHLEAVVRDRQRAQPMKAEQPE